MTTSIFEDVQQKRQQLKGFAKKALENQWIEEKDFQGIIKKIDEDTLTIGVIGQMKCGKSTFLNSFLFEEEVLPAATTPMTAALSIITYGEQKSIEIEFYNSDEWNEMQLQANRDISEAGNDKAIESKIKAAKELVQKATKVGGELSSILGTKKNDEFENLIEYVGADGKYVALTKSVTIFYPKEWLKGVKVVDTPGFNDPVVSREERTQEFLKQADVVLMLLYAGRAFDATDRDIVFEKVRNVGIGRVLIGINKYDLCYGQGETITEITENVKVEIKKACREYRDPAINELLKNLEPIPFSANMALMSKMSMTKINNDDTLKFHWNKACDNFEISSQKEMFEKSLISNLENAIRTMIETSKEEILFKKPINQILQAGNVKKNNIEKTLSEKKELHKSLSTPDHELDERIKGMTKAQRRVERKIEGVVVELEDGYGEEVRKIIRNIENEIDSTQKKMMSEIDTAGMGAMDKTNRKLQSLTTTLLDRRLPRLLEDSTSDLNKLLRIKSNELHNDIEDVLKEYMEDYDDILESFVSVIKKVRGEVNGEIFAGRGNNIRSIGYNNFMNTFFDRSLILTLIAPIPYPINKLQNLFSWKDDFRKWVEENINGRNISAIVIELNNLKSSFIEKFQGEALNGILSNLVQELESLQGNKAEKEANLIQLKEELKTLETQKVNVDKQIQEMQELKVEIGF